MKKISLDLERLVVESFETSGRGTDPGTVRAHGLSDTTCGQDYCTCPTGSGITCDDSCNASCGDTCYPVCTGISDCEHPLSACNNCTPGGTCL